MAINFPSTAGQATDGSFTHTESGVTWSWDGITWKATGVVDAETDPVYSASAAANVTSTKITEWDTAYGWGDHAAAGYLGSQATNVVIGNATTGAAITTAVDNVVLGNGSGSSITTGYDNVVLGFEAGTAITGKNDNIFIGSNAGKLDLGSLNIAIGSQAGDVAWGEYQNIENISIGRNAGNGIRRGNGNIALGEQALSCNSTNNFCFGNIAIGYQAMSTLSGGLDGGNYNTCIGQQAGYRISSGETNVLIGDYAASSITSGSYNVMIGAVAGDDISTGSNNVIINGGNYQNGVTSGFTTSTSNSLWIGHSSYPWIKGTSSGNTRDVEIPGQLTAGGLAYPTSNGISGQVLTSDGVGNVTWAASSGGSGGSGLQTRVTSQGTTSTIADGASDYITITAAKTYVLHKIQTSHAAWVTVYTDTGSRTNDASRSENTNPVPGSGVIAEVITSGAVTQKITPGTIGWNDDATPSSNVYLKVVNKSGSSQAITVTLHHLQLEA